MASGNKLRAHINSRFETLDFSKDGKVLSRKTPLATLLTANSATLKISNKKNGQMGKTIHQELTGKKVR